jgi:hypothetical protein
MLLLSKRTFSSEDFRSQPKTTYENIRFDRCSFEGCGFSYDHPEKRGLVRNIQMTGCDQRGCFMSGVAIEDVLVDGLRTNGQAFFFFACVFKHVVFKGKIGSTEIRNGVSPGLESPYYRKLGIPKLFRDANAEYYKQVDWALDISQGDFTSFSIIDVPTRLIRRDPETQVVITREKLLAGEWKNLKFQWKFTAAYLETTVEESENNSEPEFILIAGKRSKDVKDFVEDLRLLRKMGVVEPD